MKGKNTYGVVIQARLSSSRLPRKVLMDVEGKPLLQRQIERLTAGIGEIPLIVATSQHESDHDIEIFCKEQDVACFRGPLDDVMLRFIQCAENYGWSHIIRIGGDDPLVDHNCCKELVMLHQNRGGDFLYASNQDGWPFGCAAELIKVESLRRIHNVSMDPFYLEHTIPYFFDYSEEFSMHRVIAPEILRRPELAFTVDFPEDLELIRTIFRELRHEGDFFPLLRVIELLDEKPEIRSINHHLHQGFDH